MYPKHLSEKIREELALSYLGHELRKIFPSIDKKEILGLMSSKELCNPRDFWNGLHGISMGFKLKNILYLITAENVTLSKKQLKCRDISFGVELESTRKIRTGKITGQEFADYYCQNDDARESELKSVMKIRGNNLERESDPIVVIENNKIMSVHDGNGRLARHILENKKDIWAFVGKMEGKVLINYWLPTSFLIEYLFYVYKAIDDKNEELFNNQLIVLKAMLNNSESGKYEFEKRALTNKQPYRSKILGELGDLAAADN